jgi:hypothetical protein
MADEPMSEKVPEIVLDVQMAEYWRALVQPLLDSGWQLDFERKGITRPGVFIPLAALKEAVEILESPPGLGARFND